MGRSPRALPAGGAGSSPHDCVGTPLSSVLVQGPDSMVTVAVSPGATTLTRMPGRPSSMAAPRASMLSPSLAASTRGALSYQSAPAHPRIDGAELLRRHGHAVATPRRSLIVAVCPEHKGGLSRDRSFEGRGPVRRRAPPAVDVGRGDAPRAPCPAAGCEQFPDPRVRPLVPPRGR